ncbi:MAG: InlB B-repeat-containing protein [Bacilli bacterium]|nr:InlB B-repeat-containing protein [Bacilli bacterium]
MAVYYTRNTYEVRYFVGGAEYQVVNYKYEAEITALEEPDQEGYTFSGWSALPSIMPAEDLEVNGSFTVIEYDITYQLNGGNFGATQPSTYDITKELMIANPSKTGYIFLGWTGLGSEEPIKDFQIVVGTTGDLNLVANWKIIVYAIQYFEGGNLLTLTPNSYTIVDAVSLPIPEKTGNEFLGWYDNSEFIGDAVEEILTGSTGPRTYYALFEPITYPIYYYEGSNLINNPNLIWEYTYNEIDDLALVFLEKTGHSFTWLDEEDNSVSAIPAGSMGVINLYANYSINSYDVSFYHESGELIGTLYNVLYGTEITLGMFLEGKPADVAKLIELNLNIIYLNQGIIAFADFQVYLQNNAAAIMDISEQMASAVETVFVLPSSESIEALMQAADGELAKLSQALDIKIYLLQDLKNKIEATVINPDLGASLFAYVYAAKGAFASYSDELSLQIGLWLASMGEDLQAFESMNSMVSFELVNAAMLRQSYRNNQPTKNGYAFVGWKLGSDTLYLNNTEGYLFAGTIIMAPASIDALDPAKVIAFYKRLVGLEADFIENDNYLSWDDISNEELSTIYDDMIQTIEVEYEIYIEDGEGNLSLYLTTILNHITLDIIGAYNIKVIPVVKVYEEGILVNTINASISASPSTEVIVKKTENEAVLEASGNYYHKALDGGNYIFYFFSNTEISFSESNFTILSGNDYVTVKNQNTLVIGSSYTTGSQDIEFTFTASEEGPVYTARIYPYISQYELGESLTDYNNTTNSIEDALYYDKDVEPYYVGKAILGVDDADVLNNDNAFYFDLLVKTTGGKKIDLPSSQLEYKAYEIIDGVETEVTISPNTSGEWQIYRDGKNFYFKESGKTYKITIEIKELYVPKALKDSSVITKKSFVITTNEGINVFTNEDLQIAYANNLVKGINLHRDIEAKLNNSQTYRDPDDGLVYPYNFYASDLIELYNNDLSHHSGNVYQRFSVADTENPDNLVINGNYFTIDGSKLPYTNYEPGNIGLTVGGITYEQASALPTATGYKIRNVQIAIFNHIALDYTTAAIANYGGVTYHNLTVIGNTKTPSIIDSEGSDQIKEALETMSRNSGGYVAIANNYNLTLAVDNVVIGSSTIAIWSNGETTINVNNAHLYNSWANTIYSYGGSELSVSNSVLETSGGAAIHVEDTKYSSVYAQTIFIDTSSVEINNWVSGEEPWFKAYSMELAAMQMKAQINSGVSASLGASILRSITDISTGLMSRKMNFVLLMLPVSEQRSPSPELINNTEVGNRTTPGYTDATFNMYQSSNWYPYDVAYGSGYLVQLSEAFFEYMAIPTGQTYNSVALPFGEQRNVNLASGVSDLGTNIYTNYLAVQLDLSSVDRGHGIVIIGLDNPRS